MSIDPKFAREKLREQVCEVIFIKKNGEERSMTATLMSEFLPFVEEADAGPSNDERDTITVLDLEIDEWRAFNASRVKEFRYDVKVSDRPLADLYR